MELHYGQPRKPMCLRFLSGTIFMRTPRKGQNVFYSREIKSWLGFSWRGRWFIGFIRTGEQMREDIALTKAELNEMLGENEQLRDAPNEHR